MYCFSRTFNLWTDPSKRRRQEKNVEKLEKCIRLFSSCAAQTVSHTGFVQGILFPRESMKNTSHHPPKRERRNICWLTFASRPAISMFACEDWKGSQKSLIKQQGGYLQCWKIHLKTESFLNSTMDVFPQYENLRNEGC